MESDPTPVRAALEASRRELLDVGLRNPLIDVRPGNRRGVEIVDERSADVFRVLVGDARPMDFLPAPEVDPGGDLPQLGPERHVDTHLQTPHTSAELHKRLFRTAHDARTLLEEQGVNLCSLTLGALLWRDGDDAERHAPLLLVPVALARAHVRTRYVVRHTEEEPRANLALASRLRADHGIELPPFPEDGDLATYFADVAQRVAHLAGWRVEADACRIGLFSFARFLLYRDLAADAWPAGADPANHRVVRAVLGEGFPPALAAAPDRRPLDVLDADGSQAAVLADVAAGRDLVVQGPPGTGKSQTIANLIAAAAGAGRRVLFVAEKMAALEVVKRRLDGVGLGALCLELHSHKSNKRAVLDALSQTLALGRPQTGDEAETRAALEAATRRLDAYREALLEPVGASGVTPYEAFGGCLELADARPLPPLSFAPMAEWTRADFTTRSDLVAELQAKVAALGRPADHPFFGCGLRRLHPEDAPRIAREIADAQAALRQTIDAHAALATLLDRPAPADPRAAERLRSLARRFAEAPDIGEVDVASADWVARGTAVGEALALVAEIAEVVAAHPDVVEEAWHSDLLVTPAALLEVRRELATYNPKWWRVFSGRFRGARRQLAMLCTVAPPTGDEALALLDDLLAARRRQLTLAQHHPLCARLFRSRWRAWQSSASELRAIFDFVAALHRDAPDAVPRAARPWNRETLTAAIIAAEAASTRHDELTKRLFGSLRLAASEAYGEQRLSDWAAGLDRLAAWCGYADLAARCADAGLGEVVAVADTWPEAGVRLMEVFTYGWFGGLVNRARSERPALADFDRARHETVRARFARLDVQVMADHRARIAADHFAQLPRGGVGEMGLLRREMAKKARHLPIRRLLGDAAHAIQRIKPVFMMSPLSVATYLAPDGPRFDLVVFDEASQVRPVDALGALARATQAVVVGDDKQMPPTRFFQRVVDGDDLDDGANVTADLESILDLFVAAGAPSRTLRWHYRSRDPSLVAVSNRLFYGDSLVLFPGTGRSDVDLGLHLRPVPDGVYDRGGTRTNAIEARAVAEAVLAHAAAAPERTLGVVAFSTAQTDAILDALERLRREHPEHERFFGAHPSEPFFVKNLENVQGDERDVVFVSVGYGRGPDGRIALNFGPLNLAGGQRRLNVLMTRARLRCELFTHLHADDIDLSRTAAEGVHALRAFLEFARVRQTQVLAHGGQGSAFERALQARLTTAGHEVHRQVGTPSLHIDLALVDPGDGARYRLAIECDGATYAHSHTTRERERLRTTVLRRLGWRVHRTWSAAAVDDPDGAVARAQASIHAADAAAVPEAATPHREGGPVPRVVAYARFDRPIRFGKQGIEGAAPDRLGYQLRAIVEHEGPVSVECLARRVVACSPDVPRFAQGVLAAVERALEASDLERRGDFVWADDSAPPIRERSGLDREFRRTASIPPEERVAALVHVAWTSGAVRVDELLPATIRTLGLPRSEAEHTAEWQAAIDRALQSGLVLRGDRYSSMSITQDSSISMTTSSGATPASS